MIKRLSASCILIIFSVSLMTSCSDIGIVKRRHLPGYHVDLGSRSQKAHKSDQEEISDKQDQRVIKVNAAKLPKVQLADTHPQQSEETQLSASAELNTSHLNSGSGTKSAHTWRSMNLMMRQPIKELQKQELNDEFRRAVFNDEDEKHGWSVLSIISTGLGVAALAMVITGLALLVSFIFSGGLFYWWIFALIGLVLGIAAMVTGIIGLRQTGRSGGKRGRGFALGGMIGGIVSLALGLIGLFWGLLHRIINNNRFE